MTSTDFADFAQRYAALGLRVFPLHWIKIDDAGATRCSCGDADCRSIAKHPLTARGVNEASADSAIVSAWWTQWPGANIGMALDGLAAIDTDPRNGGDVTLETLQDQHGRLPDTSLALTGGGGTHHLYRMPDGVRLPGKLGKGVDLKRGAGAYIVVEPSLHASGMSYAWEASSSLLDGVMPAPLPEWIASLSPVNGQAAVSDVPLQAAVGMIAPRQQIELRSALCALDADDRETWLAVGMALHSTNAPNAFGIWTEWSQLSAKYRAADQKRVWASFSSKPNGRHVESIFAMATKAGWVNPASAAATKFQTDVEQYVAEANARTRIETIDVPAPAPTGEFPVPILNELAAWIDGRASMTHPDVTTQTALAIAALAASRVYVGEGNTPCHLCLGIIADSGTFTSYARDSVSAALEQSGVRRMFRGNRANAPSNVYSTLWRSPAAIHVIPDFGHLAQFAKRQPSGVLDQAFSVMADAYALSALYVDSAVEAGLRPSATDDQLVVHSPALTTLLLSTREQIGGLLQRGEIARGLMAYQLPVIVDTAGVIERTPTHDAFPPVLRERLRAVRRLQNLPGELSQAEIFGQQPGQRPNLVRVRYAVEFAEYAAAICAVSVEAEHRPIVLAGINTAKRIANVLAAWNDPAAPVATRPIIEWSVAYVIRLLRAWLEQYSTLGNEDGKADVGQKIVAAITERKTAGIERSKLQNFCWAFRLMRDKDKRNKLVDGLIEDGDLIEFTPEGKRIKVLVAAKFARRVELKLVSSREIETSREPFSTEQPAIERRAIGRVEK